jgi:hypothetical protein
MVMRFGFSSNNNIIMQT